MKCSRIEKQLPAYQHGELGERTVQRVESHLDGCTPCRQEVASLSGISDLLASLPLAEPSPFLISRTMVRIRTEGQRTSWSFGEVLKVRHLVPVAVCSLLVLMLSAGILPSDGGSMTPVTPDDPRSCWVTAEPMVHGEATVVLTMGDMRAFQPVRSTDYLIALGALQDIPKVAEVSRESDKRRVTHIIDFSGGGRIESEITFAGE